MIVMKFGGTSVRDAEAIARLVEIVTSRLGESPTVVVSALAGVTDDLHRLAGSLDMAPGGVASIVAQLRERHMAVADALRVGTPARDQIMSILDALTGDLDSIGAEGGSDADLDRALGAGELLSSALVAGALRAAGLPAEWFDARRVILTDDRFTRANPRTNRIRARVADELAPLLDRGAVPVTQGFIGSAPDGRPSTLGRGGGDFTASLLGAALSAERVEIWTDVDGLMTADPRIVPSATRLERATYDEVAELATFGARVLHPATQTRLAEEGIPIVVLNAQRPDGSGTTITHEGLLDRPGDSPVRSISWKPGIVVVNVRAPRMFGAYGFLRRLFQVFETFEIPVDVLASGEVSVSLTVDQADWRQEAIEALSDLGVVTAEPGRAIISVVGERLRGTPGIAARVFEAIQPANVEMISQGSSAINVTFVVEEHEGVGAVQRLHQAFFGS